MLQTFAALLLAHALADFVLQTRWMVDNKRGWGLGVHIAIVAVTAAAVTGALSWAILLVTALHLAIDLVKTHLLANRFEGYLADQAAHIASLVLVAYLAPGLWVDGLWGGFDMAPPLIAAAAGLILATRGGQFAVQRLLLDWFGSDGDASQSQTAVLIGILERLIIFMLILSGEIAAIGILLAAKALFQFTAETGAFETRSLVVAGTLASFAWGMGVAFGAVALIGAV